MNSKEFIKSQIVKLEDDLQHYTMVDKDKVKVKYIEFELEKYKQILKELEHLEQQNEKHKKVIEILKENPMCIVDVLRFNNYFIYREFYNGVVELTKRDFDLSKEVLSE